MRIILYTGKGGVGKTSIAAATALKIAESGKKVMIMSTDQAHSLGDSFDMKLSNKETKISDNLYGMEIDVIEESEHVYGHLKTYINNLLTVKSENSIEAEELLAFPGFEELCSLLKVREFYDMNLYDVIIVDCAPTGETLSLLKFPEMLEDFMTRLFPMKRLAINIVGPIIEKTTKIPMPKSEHFNEFEKIFKKLNSLRDLMGDKDILSIRIVTTPEKIVINETKRNFTFMHLFQYNVDAVIVNKIYPEESLKGYFNQWIINQEKGLKEIDESFAGIPIFHLKLMKNELRGKEALKKAYKELYGENEPDKVLYRDTMFEIIKEDETYIMRFHLPYIDKRDMDILHKGEELIIMLKNERRSFILPDKLKSKEITKAEYNDGWLKIRF